MSIIYDIYISVDIMIEMLIIVLWVSSFLYFLCRQERLKQNTLHLIIYKMIYDEESLDLDPLRN